MLGNFKGFLPYLLDFLLLETRMLAIAPVRIAIIVNNRVFSVNFTLPSKIHPVTNERTEYKKAVNKAETIGFSGFFPEAMAAPVKTPNIVPTIAAGSVYLSGKSVKQRRSDAPNNMMKVIISEIATVLIIDIK